MTTVVIVAWALGSCAALAALTRWEERRRARRMTSVEKWAWLATRGVHKF